jgi:hypothetical protein
MKPSEEKFVRLIYEHHRTMAFSFYSIAISLLIIHLTFLSYTFGKTVEIGFWSNGLLWGGLGFVVMGCFSLAISQIQYVKLRNDYKSGKKEFWDSF